MLASLHDVSREEGKECSYPCCKLPLDIKRGGSSPLSWKGRLEISTKNYL